MRNTLKHLTLLTRMKDDGLLPTLTGSFSEDAIAQACGQVETLQLQERLHIRKTKRIQEELVRVPDFAALYTSAGGSIQVRVRDWEMYLRIDVTDTGRGIPEHSQGTIFKRFYRDEAVHDIDGVGIGLYLAREIITMQGGYITVESKVGEGSTFSVFLPIK